MRHMKAKAIEGSTAAKRRAEAAQEAKRARLVRDMKEDRRMRAYGPILPPRPSSSAAALRPSGSSGGSSLQAAAAAHRLHEASASCSAGSLASAPAPLQGRLRPRSARGGLLARSASAVDVAASRRASAAFIVDYAQRFEASLRSY